MLLQTYFLYPAAVFWAYRPSCLVLTAALAPPPPPLPMHLPLKRQSETTENRKCKHDTGGSDFAGVPPPTSMAQRDLNRLASGLRIQVGVVHINLDFRASTSQRTSNQVPSTNRVGKSVGPARRFGFTRTPLHPEALASVPCGVVLVRVRDAPASEFVAQGGHSRPCAGSAIKELRGHIRASASAKPPASSRTWRSATSLRFSIFALVSNGNITRISVA